MLQERQLACSWSSISHRCSQCRNSISRHCCWSIVIWVIIDISMSNGIPEAALTVACGSRGAGIKVLVIGTQICALASKWWEFGGCSRVAVCEPEKKIRDAKWKMDIAYMWCPDSKPCICKFPMEASLISISRSVCPWKEDCHQLDICQAILPWQEGLPDWRSPSDGQLL